jgi:hypothetical protein
MSSGFDNDPVPKGPAASQAGTDARAEARPGGMYRRKPSINAILLAVAATAVIGNCWWRGPFFGLLPFLVLVLPPAALIGVLLRYARLPRRVVLVMVVLGTACISWFFCAPPTTGRLFTRHLGISISNDVRDLRRWNDNWARDPGFYLRFGTSEKTVLEIVKSARLVEAPSWRSAVLPPPRFLVSIPEWWKPHEIESPRVWQGRDARREFWLNLYFEPQSSLAYLEVLTT